MVPEASDPAGSKGEGGAHVYEESIHLLFPASNKLVVMRLHDFSGMRPSLCLV